MRPKKIQNIFLSLVFLLMTPKLNLAADVFELSYSLIEGGSRLELDTANVYKGVKLEVTCDVAVRYEVIQNVLRPLENRDRPGEMIRDNLVLRGLRGTNIYGTLHIPTSDMPVRSGERLYTSNATGSPDTFTLVYGLTDIENIPAGNYQGQISFTLRPIGAARSEVTKYLYVYVTIGEKEGVSPKIEITPANGSSIISLKSQRPESQAAEVWVKINGSLNKPFRIMQMPARPLESDEGRQLDYAVINLATKEVDKGSGIPQDPLSAKSQVIYSSGGGQDVDDSFVVIYSLGDFSQQKAGRYTSRIQYLLDEMGVQSTLGMLELDVEIDSVFELALSPENRKDSIEFKNLRPMELPRENEVVVEVKTNVGKQYQVSQNVFSQLTNSEGDVIPVKYFTLRTEDYETKGTLKFPQKEEVKTGDAVLFVSDPQGSADKFKVVYELTCPTDLKAGNYSTRITYSLLEI